MKEAMGGTTYSGIRLLVAASSPYDKHGVLWDAHRKFRSLREKVKGEHMRAAKQGNAAYDAHNDPIGHEDSYRNPNPGGSGPRPRAEA